MVVFDLGAVLSVTTSILLCSHGDLYEVLNFMTGDNLFTHQLPRAAKDCQPHILQQHPGLGAIDASDVTRENWEVFLSEQKRRFGDVVPLVPLAEWESIDPVDEMVEMVGEDKVVVCSSEWPIGASSNSSD